MHKQMFHDAFEVLDIINEAGHEAFIVGGAVRDYYLNRQIGDIDIASSATPSEIIKLFKDVIPVGIKHGTVIVRYKKKSYEVTTYRTETGYSDYRHPDKVEFVTDILTDLSRRDFTINAMAMDKHFKIEDPFEGKKDIERRLIRTVRNPFERFEEDPLRMMRGLRFSSQLNFKMDIECTEAIHSLHPAIEYIAVERIAVEWEKMFKGENVQYSLRLLFQTNLVNCLPLIKESKQLKRSLLKHQARLFSMAEIVTTFYLYDSSIHINKWAKEWKLSSKAKRNAIILADLINDVERKEALAWIIYRLPKELISSFCRTGELFVDLPAKNMLKYQKNKLPISNRKELALNGNDIISTFPERKQGKWIDSLLLEIEKKVVLGEIDNTKLAIKEWLLHEKK
ncbi:CCA tRNA nucleotidyltransferase [Saliterribacillus persicus]|uniref:CCA-adding enzyme n=1 Tax=Saliterribacillus persicus TaxID=930114 RepID=A0A368XAE6_9BACI|nr:CCA tRNA nucleotidyltransferase [Saliterribacillus persicus]RCW64933.1 tRNA nucleotidyltransferase (CCA-adding enzyme) [Saliterribacillus persicus]